MGSVWFYKEDWVTIERPALQQGGLFFLAVTWQQQDIGQADFWGCGPARAVRILRRAFPGACSAGRLVGAGTQPR